MLGKVGNGVIASGYAAKDADLRYVGNNNTAMCLFSVNAGKRDDDSVIFVNCKAWRDLATIAAGIRKYDPIFVSGRIEEQTGNDGKTYKNLVADFVWNAAWGMEAARADAPAPNRGPDEFTELSQDEDDELPF